MGKENYYKCFEIDFFIQITTVVVLVLIAGLMSGLTLALMSMSIVDLEVIAKSGTPKDSRHAAKILPLVKRQHLLLCTLLLSNAAAMEALPVFLHKLVPDLVAILFSVTLILLFGEIIPQSVCSRYGLVIGAATALVVRVLIWICYPVAYPICKVFDLLLGKGHNHLLGRVELKTLVDLHGAKAGKGGELSQHETTIISGALELTEKTAKDAMTPISETFAIDINAKLNKNENRDMINMIMEKGHSRLPVYHDQSNNFIGLIMVKNLLTINPADELPASSVTIRQIPRVSETMPLYNILNEFQKGISHMAAVVKHSQNHNISSEQIGLMSEVKVEIHNGGSSQKRSRRSLRSLKNSPASRANPKSRRCSSNKFSLETFSINEGSISTVTQPGEVVGIITMEDIIEELLKEEIYDETDNHEDSHS